MQVQAQLYKGIEFVRIADLPPDQKNRLKTSFNERLIIKVLIDDVVISDCIQAKHYCDWYKSEFRKTTAPGILDTFSNMN